MISASPTDLPERSRSGHPVSRSLKPVSTSQNHRTASFSSNSSSSLPPKGNTLPPPSNRSGSLDPVRSTDLPREKHKIKPFQHSQSYDHQKLQTSAVKVKPKVRPFESTDSVRVKSQKSGSSSVSGPAQDENKLGSTGGTSHSNGHDVMKTTKPSSRASSPFSSSGSSRQADRPSSAHSHRGSKPSHSNSSNASSQKTKRQATSPVFSNYDSDRAGPQLTSKPQLDVQKSSQGNGKPSAAKPIPPPPSSEAKSKPLSSADSASSASGPTLPSQAQPPALTRSSAPPKKKVDRFGGTSLARRAEKGNLSGVEDAYATDPSELNQADNAGVAPLQKAACHGHLAVVKFLIDKGCRLTCADQEGDTPLIDAVANGHLPIVKVLLRAGVNPHHANRYGRRAIDYLPTKDDEDCEPIDNEIRDLLWEAMQSWAGTNALADQEPVVAPPTESKSSTRHDLLYIECTLANLRKFAGQGDAVAVNHIMSMVVPDVSCAVAAARGGHNVILSFILATMDPSEKDPDPLKYSETPILAAIGRGHIDILELILNQDNFNPTRRTKEGKTYWQVAEERRGPKWPVEVQLLKKRYDDYDTSKPNVVTTATKKRTAAIEATEGASRPAKLARTAADRTSSVSSKPKLAPPLHRSSASTSSSEKTERASISAETERSNGHAIKQSRNGGSHKETRERPPSSSSSPPPPIREPLARRRRVVDDDEDDEEELISDRQSPAPEKPTNSVSAKPVSQALSKPSKSGLKSSKNGSSSDKKHTRPEKPDLSKGVKRERLNSVGESNRPGTGVKLGASPATFDGREVQTHSERKNSKVASDKDESLQRRRASISREAKHHPSSTLSHSREKPDRPKARISLDSISIEEKELLTQEIRDRIEREERSRIAKEERERIIQEERARILQEEKELFERERIERERRQREEEEAAERERQRLTEEKQRASEEAARRLAEETEAARKAVEDEENRRREELLDSLPLALSHAIRAGTDRPLRAVGLKMGIVEQFLPIWTVPFREISSDPSSSRKNERWMMSWQVVGLLGLPELDLASSAVGLSHWERIQVTEDQMDAWMRFYTGQQLSSLEVSWPDSSTYCASLEAAKVDECRARLRALWAQFCWVRLSDFLAEIERRNCPDLRSLCIGQVDEGSFVSPDGTGYGGRYVEGHAAFGQSETGPATIRELIFQSHGLPCPKDGASVTSLTLGPATTVPRSTPALPPASATPPAVPPPTSPPEPTAVSAPVPDSASMSAPAPAVPSTRASPEREPEVLSTTTPQQDPEPVPDSAAVVETGMKDLE